MNVFVYQTNSFQFFILDEDYTAVYIGLVMLYVVYDWQRDRIFRVKQFHKRHWGGLLLLVLLLFRFSLSLSLCVPIARNPGRMGIAQARSIADIRGRCVCPSYRRHRARM